MLKQHTMKQVIRTVFSVGIIFVLFHYVDWAKLLASFSSIQPLCLILVFLLLVPGLLIRSRRWLILFNNQSFSVTFRDSTKLLMAGMCLNLILPASLGDVAKSYLGYRWSGIKERMLSISLLDKVIALSSVCLLGLPFAIYRKHYHFGVLALLVILFGMLFMALPFLLHHGKIFRQIVHFFTRCLKSRIDMFLVIDQMRTTKRKLVCAILLSVLGWMITYFQLYLIFRGLQVRISVFYVFAAAPFLTLVRLFPFALQGLGTDELAICFVFRQAGIGYEESMAAALLYRFFLLILPGLVGLAILLKHKQADNTWGAQ